MPMRQADATNPDGWGQNRFPVRKLAGIVVVILIHVVAVRILITGLAQHPADAPPPPPVEARIITPPKLAPPEPPKPVVVKPVVRPPPSIPKPVVRVATPPPAPNAIHEAISEKPAPPAPPAPVAPALDPVRVPASVAAGGSCRLPQYPALSRRNHEMGTVIVTFLVDSDGTVLESRVESSSGHDRLDDAAREALALCHFQPGTVDGRPERSWARIRYVWKLE